MTDECIGYLSYERHVPVWGRMVRLLPTLPDLDENVPIFRLHALQRAAGGKLDIVNYRGKPVISMSFEAMTGHFVRQCANGFKRAIETCLGHRIMLQEIDNTPRKPARPRKPRRR